MKKDFSKLVLLDVNVLLALAWPNHQFHMAAMSRLNADKCKWATCALTELGFIRLSSNATIVGVSKSPLEAAMLLALMIKDSQHVYLESLPSPASPLFLKSCQNIMCSKQVTDAYLLALAQMNQAILLTFDTRITAHPHSTGSIEVIT
jgi:uncharacterized protein